MKTIRQALKLRKQDYYEKHLSIINPMLPEHLTPGEIRVLAAFMSLDEGLKKYMFGTTSRKEVMNTLNLSPGGLGNYLRDLKLKEFIIEEQGEMRILPILIPEEKQQDYQFKLIIDES